MSTAYIAKEKPEKNETAHRKCLMCQKTFHSKHKGNRICVNCKNGNKYKCATGIGDAIRGNG